MKIDSIEEALKLKADLYEKLSQAEAAGLPDADCRNVALLIDAGEYVVALENLATQIYELDVEITSAERAGLESLGERLGVPVPFLLGDPWAERN